MNSNEITSLIVKILLLVLTPIATKYHLDGNLVPAFATDLADAIVVAFSIYRNTNSKLVPENSTAIVSSGSLPAVGQSVPLPGGTVAKVVGALLAGFLIFHAAPSLAQTADANANPATPVTNSCDLLTILKGMTAQNFIAKLETCSSDDLKMAIDNATQAPADNLSLACFTPAQVVIANIKNGGLIYKAQLFRRAKQAGLLTNCTAWANSFLAP